MYTIGQVAKKLGIECTTLRYYEKEGLLSFHREPGGIRFFDDEDLERLENILFLKGAGMSVKEIGAYLQLCDSGDNMIGQRLTVLYGLKKDVL